jgi:hypothetical protein
MEEEKNKTAAMTTIVTDYKADSNKERKNEKE